MTNLKLLFEVFQNVFYSGFGTRQYWPIISFTFNFGQFGGSLCILENFTMMLTIKFQSDSNVVDCRVVAP